MYEVQDKKKSVVTVMLTTSRATGVVFTMKISQQIPNNEPQQTVVRSQRYLIYHYDSPIMSGTLNEKKKINWNKFKCTYHSKNSPQKISKTANSQHKT